MRKTFTVACLAVTIAGACSDGGDTTTTPPHGGGNVPLPTMHAGSGADPMYAGATPVTGSDGGVPADLATAPAPDLATASPHDLALPSPSPDLATPPPTALRHTRCGWMVDDPIEEQSFIANAAWFDTVHPKWWQLDADGGGVHAVGNTDKATIVSAAASNNVRLMPLIDIKSVTGLRTLINSATLRAQHAADLVAIAQQHGYVGFDIDYEHLWTAADRPGYTALMQTLSTAFHAAGLELSMALEPMGYDDGNNGYDYNALAAACDTLHMMNYDFHWLGGDHLGPLAPLAWVDASFALAEATGHRDRFMIGLANYAIGASTWTTAHDAAAHCTAAPSTSTNEGTTTCPYTHYSDGRVLHCDTGAGGVMWFEDVGSMEEKIQVAKSHGARGVTYWTIGDELPGFFNMVKTYYP
jgi:spore germination protein YaaH